MYKADIINRMTTIIMVLTGATLNIDESISNPLGLIFGPLLISYFILLVKIYRNEFNAAEITPVHSEKTET